ncbi:MAG TPA: hypothetical protein VGO92_11290 [Acidimicrobiales bacterium]|nr:hypothetical protein [Acidimicrobiales bacterium]
MADSPERAVESAETDEALRRQVLLALGALVVFLLAAGIALAVSRSGGGVEDATVGSVDDALIGTGTGPLAGTDVATYSAGRQRALAEAKGRWVAVVSLRDYTTEADFTRLFGGLSPEAVLVATEAGEPQVVAGGLGEWAAKARSEAEEERTQLRSMADSTEEKSFKDQFLADIDRLGQLLDHLDPAKPVVFGFVVTGSAASLRQLADRPEVRLVDLVGRREPSSLDRLRGLRPEETVRAAEPRTRPL